MSNVGKTSFAILIAFSLTACAQKSADLNLSQSAKQACELSEEVFAEGYSLANLPGVLDLSRSGTLEAAPLSEFSHYADARSEIRSMLDDLRSKQANGALNDTWVFGVGYSSQNIPAGDVNNVSEMRQLHADFARIRATGDIFERLIFGRTIQTIKKDSQSVNQKIDGSRAVFGIVPIATKESVVNNRYTYATLLGWSEQFESVFKGVALGCWSGATQLTKADLIDIEEAVTNAVRAIPQGSIPVGGRKAVFSNGSLGFLGFGAFPTGDTASSADEALRSAQLQSRVNALREVYSEYAFQANFEMTMNVSEGDFQAADELNRYLDRRLEGIRLPGLRNVADAIVRDPLTNQRMIVVVSGVFPQSSERVVQALRRTIVGRFRDETKLMGVE